MSNITTNENQLLPGWNIQEPHFMHAGEGCMGNPIPSYWRCFGVHRAMGSHATQIGSGGNPRAAKEDCIQKCLKHQESIRAQM